jgi:4-hydroxy-4-methyl-2-oxoglutarate aldolase
MTEISHTTLETLRQYDTPTICNVIELFDVRPRAEGYMDRSIKAAYPNLPPMVGFAATATCRTAVKPSTSSAYTALPDQVEQFDTLSGSAVVVFQDLDGADAAATFGEIMCSTYKAFGAVGLITNGPGRDLGQVRALEFPVFINGAVCSHGYIHILDTLVPVQVGGLTVYPDDLLHGDCNGITTIPLEIASSVADACAEYIAAEQNMLDVIHSAAIGVTQLRQAAVEKDHLMEKLRARIGR